MLSIICEAEFHETDSFSKSKSHANLLANKHVENVHSNLFFKELITKLHTENLEANELKEQVKSLISDHVETYKDNEAERYEIISLAISCLQCFVQANWLGPLPEQTSNLPVHLQKSDPNDFSKKMFFLKDFLNTEEYETFQEKLRLFMSSDGEYVIPSVKCVHFLVLARFVLIDFVDQFQSVPLINWWSLRTIYLYQQLFEERPQTLSAKSLDLIDSIAPHFDEKSTQQELVAQYDKEVLRFASIIFHLEASNSYYQNYNWTKAQEFYDRALSTSAISFEMTGVLGKRTKFQKFDVAQLFLKVNDTRKVSNNFQQWLHFNKEPAKSLMPKDLSLNDDTLLEKVKISNPQDEKLLESGKGLSQLEHIVLYGILHDYHKNSAKTELTHEELSPFIEFLLSNSVNWCVNVVAMFMRAKLEATNTRRMERSLMQLETLIENFYTKNTERADIDKRLQFFYSIPFPPIWVLNKEMAQFYMKLGLLNSASEIYLKLQMWSELIDCYQALDKRDQAEELIKKRLAIKETPELYCSLGEVTNDIQYFQKAIELSKGRSAKGYRMLAKHQFARQQYTESIENFEKSLEINRMQYNTWFMLGSAAFRSDKWPTAVKAFRQCTHLEPDSHEVWNNLAASYIKMKEKNKAHAVFQEALKYAYDNAKIWENFLWTSTDCCYFEDVVRAYNRLLDIKEKYVDTDVLQALKTSVVKKLKDPNGVSIYNYKQGILKLFGRLTSTILTNWKIFWYYGEIVLEFGMNEEKTLTPVDITPETVDKALGYFYKSFKILYNQPNWDITVDSCDEILSVSTDLLTKCIEYGKTSPFMKDMSGSLSLTVKSLITKLKTKYSVDKNNNQDCKYDKLLYLADVNTNFVQLQQEYEKFRTEFLSN